MTAQLLRMQSALLDNYYFVLTARVTAIQGPLLKVGTPLAKLGELCSIRAAGGKAPAQAEVVGLDKDGAMLLPFSDLQGTSRSDEVVFEGVAHTVPVGQGLLGTIVDGLGRALQPDGSDVDHAWHSQPIYRAAPDALARTPVDTALATGVRAIDGLLSLGVGQRLGLFAAAGMGKTSLLTMLLHGVAADVVVLALVGERGREVNEFLAHIGVEARQKCVVVVATSDRPPVERMKAAFVATSYAEYFRTQGKRVLLLVDSLTRLARAQREIGLACGEPPLRNGFPSSVFSMLSQLIERAGNDQHGSISAIYTVLVEGDDHNEPVADEARSLLDGHLVLSGKLAAAGRFPAIDIARSVSRVMTQVAAPYNIGLARQMRQLLAKYEEIELLVTIGEYERGHDALGDLALDKIEAMRGFLQQAMDETSHPDQTRATLEQLLQC